MTALAQKAAGMIVTGGELVVRLLEAYGVDTVFGIPGVHTFGLYRGLAASSLRHITTRHEQGAGFMADGYARVTRKPGVCFLITGPGITNAATAIGQAYSDSVPLLILASVNARRDLGMGRGRLHEMQSQRDAIAPLVGWAHTILDANEIPAVMARAFQRLNQGRPRPVYLEFPLDVLEQSIEVPPASQGLVSFGTPAKHEIAAAARLLSTAKQPIIIIGGGFAAGPEPDVAAQHLIALAEHLSAPVITTVAGKGCFPAGHPLSLGCGLGSEPARSILAGADVILAAGTELGETDHWTARLPINGRLIRADVDPDRFVGDYPAELGLLADAQQVVVALAEACADIPHSGASDLRLKEVAEARAEQRQLLVKRQPSHMCMLEVMRQALPENVRIVSDMTQLAYTAYNVFPVHRPRSYLHPSGFGTLGYALPAAIGAALADSSRPVVAIVGDGGIQFTLPELAVAREHGLSLPVLVYNNNCYGQIELGMHARNIRPVGVRYFSPDFQLLAEAYDCAAEKPDNLQDFAKALEKACRAGRPTIIEVTDAIAR